MTQTHRQPTSSPRDSFRLAAIDVGSNSLHMIVAQADPDGGMTTLWRMKEMVGLGRMSFPARRLSRDAMDIAISALGRFQQAAQQRQSEKIVAVATSAIREATNGGEFIERAKRELGLYVRVVSAREEARLIYLAVRHAVALKSSPHFILDIGGGSVEFIVGDDKRTHLLESRKLGAARITAQFIRTDPPSKDEIRALRKHYEKELTPLCEQIRELKPIRIIGTSGTLENLAAMSSNYGGEGNSNDEEQVIERDRFEELLEDLLSSTSKDRARLRGLDDQRKDQIIAGALLVSELFRQLKQKQIQICPSALREGILLDYLNRHIPDLAIRREVPDPRRRSVLDLARRCNWQRTHSEHVAHLAMQLFDELKSLHHLDAVERELIEYGILLHDIGLHIDRDRHHRHSEYLILNGNLKNFTDEEIRIIASIARYHRKSLPRMKHDGYASLPRRGRRVVNVGTALMRIADGLDRSHSCVIQSLRCVIGDRAVRVILNPRMDAALEVWGAEKSRKQFIQAFKHAVSFELAKK